MDVMPKMTGGTGGEFVAEAGLVIRPLQVKNIADHRKRCGEMLFPPGEQGSEQYGRRGQIYWAWGV